METHSGTITDLNPKKGFGVITLEGGEKLFFHVTAVVSPRFEELKTGLPVEFLVSEDHSGRRRAIGVCVV